MTTSDLRRDHFAWAPDDIEFKVEKAESPISGEDLTTAARQAIDGFMPTWVDAIGKTTYEEVKRIVADARLTGATIDQTWAKMGRLFSPDRAKLIAVTECLPPETLVDRAVIRAAFRRRYEGPMVEVVTKGGRRFSATPNHPMLTRRGWVAAGEVEEGDDVVCDARQQRSGGTSDPDVQAPPTAIAEVFDSIAAVGLAERVRSTNPDFHGDGCNSQVDVLSPSRPLLIGDFAPLYKPTVDLFLAPSDVVRAAVCDRCGMLLSITKQECFCGSTWSDPTGQQPAVDQCAANVQRVRDEGDGFTSIVPTEDFIRADVVSEPGLALACYEKTSSTPTSDDTLTPKCVGNPVKSKSGFGGDLGSAHAALVESGYASNIGVASRVQQLCGLALASECNLVAPQGVYDPTLAGTQMSSDSLGCPPAQVELDSVISVSLRTYSGHVYNLSTPYGYFTIAGGIFTGNTTRLFGMGAQAVYEKMEIEEWSWQTVKDPWVCTTCEGRNGRKYPMEHQFEPAHPRCRCFARPVAIPDGESV